MLQSRDRRQTDRQQTRQTTDAGPALTFRQWGCWARRCWSKNFKSQ